MYLKKKEKSNFVCAFMRLTTSVVEVKKHEVFIKRIVHTFLALLWKTTQEKGDSPKGVLRLCSEWSEMETEIWFFFFFTFSRANFWSSVIILLELGLSISIEAFITRGKHWPAASRRRYFQIFGSIHRCISFPRDLGTPDLYSRLVVWLGCSTFGVHGSKLYFNLTLPLFYGRSWILYVPLLYEVCQRTCHISNKNFLTEVIKIYVRHS